MRRLTIPINTLRVVKELCMKGEVVMEGLCLCRAWKWWVPV